MVAFACVGRAGPSALPQLMQLVGDALQLGLDGGQALQLLVLQRKAGTRVSGCRWAAPAPQSYSKPGRGQLPAVAGVQRRLAPSPQPAPEFAPLDRRLGQHQLVLSWS